jgi:predicted hydrocarbon binding protein
MNPIAAIPESGLYFPNNIARIIMLSMEEVLGEHGFNSVLNQAGQSVLIGNYPPNDMEKEFDYSYFSAISAALELVYGDKSARMLAKRSGNVAFRQMIKDFGEPVNIHTDAFKALPVDEKIATGLKVVRGMFSNTKEEPIVRLDSGHFLYSVHYCPACWGRTTAEPACHLVTSILHASLSWVTDGLEFNIVQTSAHSCGAPTCDFEIPPNPIAG